MTKRLMEHEKAARPSVLKLADVMRIREMAKAGMLNVREAAKAYGVGAETIRRVVRGETWTHAKLAEGWGQELPPEQVQASQAKLAMLLAEQAKIDGKGNELLEELSKTPEQLAEDAEIRKIMLGEKNASLE